MTDNMMLLMSAAQIRNNWDAIKCDPYNNRPDIETADEYISEARKGNVTAGGVKIEVVDELPLNWMSL